jgi:hypothetical protein
MDRLNPNSLIKNLGSPNSKYPMDKRIIKVFLVFSRE